MILSLIMRCRLRQLPPRAGTRDPRRLAASSMRRRAPEGYEIAAELIRCTFERVKRSERVEVGCKGGLGRMGTVLACMAILAGVPADQAVAWVRTNYDARAIETAAQERWVQWFAGYTRRLPTCQ